MSIWDSEKSVRLNDVSSIINTVDLCTTGTLQANSDPTH